MKHGTEWTEMHDYLCTDGTIAALLTIVARVKKHVNTTKALPQIALLIVRQYTCACTCTQSLVPSNSILYVHVHA